METTIGNQEEPATNSAHDVAGADLQTAQSVYRLLVSHPGHTLPELAALTDVPLKRAKTAWRLLVSWGLIGRTGDDRYVAVDPEAALVATIGRQHAAAAQHLHTVRDLEQQARAIMGVFRPEARRGEEAGVVHYPDRAQRDQALLDLQTSCQRTTASMHRGPITVGMEVLEASLEEDRQAVQRGIQIRAIYPNSMLNHPLHAGYIKDLVTAGVEVRMIQHAPVDMVIFDGHSTLLPGNPKEASRTMLILSGRPVDTFTEIYEDCWARSIPVDLVADGEADELDPTERTIASLMLSGLTDDQIASKMSITRRTLQRRIRILQDRWDAKSRFELGFRFARVECSLPPYPGAR